MSDEDNELLKWGVAGANHHPGVHRETGIKADRLPQMLRSREYPG